MTGPHDPSRSRRLKKLRVCRLLGHDEPFYVLRLYKRKALVVPIAQPNGEGLLRDRNDLYDIGEPGYHQGLYPDPVPEETTEEEREPSPPSRPEEVALLPLPYGVLDLDSQLVSDADRVRCYVRGCQEMLRPPTRGFRGDTCKVHRIRCHISGANATYTYPQAKRNIIASPDLFARRLIGHPFKFESHRMGFEKSEDALTWNVFRSFQEAGCLHLVAELITGRDFGAEPTLYLWGIRLTDNSFRPWDLLIEARRRFESALPVKRPATEPDAGLFLPGRYLILIEAKFTSPNPFYLDGPRRDGQSLTMQELLDIYRHPACTILDTERARAADLIYYQLFRNTQFASYMASLDSPNTLAFHANLVRAGAEHESTGRFRQLIRPAFADRFTRITWEQLFVLATLRWQKLGRLIEYLATKTAGLAPAFQLDLW